ncbi:hypothetical protein DFH11DRAFT_14348 [Phellopilus nigrolimitatus]|nr:hypothetical protein DFH11DRAFT_14348 [Phellopilus nigrolimitatus]
MGPPSTIIESLENEQISNYVDVVSLALASYDFLLTFADEVRFIWPSKWGVVKVAFFLTRYVVFLDNTINLLLNMLPHLTLSLCSSFLKAIYTLSFFGILVSEFLLMIRVYAIWGNRKDVLVLLTVVLLAASIISFIFLREFLLSVVLESVAIGMTVWKSYSQWRAGNSLLVKALFEDNLRYSICMFAASMANLLVLKTASISFAGLLFELQRVLHSILSARMIMHIREAVEPQGGVCTMSALAFTNAPRERSRVDNDMNEVPLESGFSDDA